MKRKWWQIVVAVLLVVVMAAAAYVFWPVGEDLDELAAVGAQYDASILRDTWGVPHVFGVTDADAAYGLGYAHAEDDFLTIQQALAAARGKLGSIYGADMAPNDYMVQLLRLWEVLDANYESGLQPETRAVLQGYADGLNHYAALHEDEALPGLFPVSGKDVVAGFMHKTPLFYGIDGVLTELFEEERQQSVSTNVEQTARLLSGEFNWGALGAFLPVETMFGSNTLAVGPARTDDGSTFLAVNSHQPWEGPVTWYEAHVHSEEGWDAVGGIFPGAPVILHGHNRDLGWAFTVNSPDLVDVYVLDINPDNPDQYRFDGEWRDLEVREAPITVKLLGNFRWTVTEEVLWSVYGPTVRRPHGTYAIRAAGLGEVGLIEQWLRMNKAGDFETWRAAMAEGPLPMFNAGYADKDGNVYYIYNAKLPLRAEGYDWQQYLPGDTSETLWTEYLPYDELPQVLNPGAAFIQNANSTPFQTTTGAGNPDPDAYSLTFGIETTMTNRALRAIELFGRDESISKEDFVTYKYDMAYSVNSDITRYVEQLLAAPAPDDPAMQEALALLRAWDLQVTPGSEGASVAMLMLYLLAEDESAGFHPSRLNGTEVPTETLQQGLEQAVAHLQEHFGAVAVPWAEVNRLRRGEVDIGLGGGPDALHAVYGELEEDGRLRGFVGDSYVMIVEWDAAGNVSSESIHQYGSATLDESSPHYADQAMLFANRERKPVWLDEADIRANLEMEYRPGEEQSER